MGRKSTRQDKSIYQLAREAAGLTRAEASELMDYISASRIEKMESGKMTPRPEDILTMADAYRAPDLCSYYCSQICPIGRAGKSPCQR